MVEGSGKVSVDGGGKLKEEGAAQYPELRTGVPKVNPAGESEGAVCAPFTWTDTQWYGALLISAGGAPRKPFHGRPHR